jgi:hypothetical protein
MKGLIMSSKRKAGLICKYQLPSNTYLMVYEVPKTLQYSRPNISVLNMSSSDIMLNIFVTDSPKKLILPDDSTLQEGEFYLPYENGYILAKPEDFIDYNLTLKPSAVYERLMTTYDGGERIYMKASDKGLVVRINGIEESLIG